MSIFERVKEIADLRKISLQTLAEQSNMGINSIYGWKTKKPSIDKISAVADVLHVSTDYLLGRTDEPNHYMTETEKMLSGVDLSEAVDRSVPLTWGGHELDDNDKEILRRLFEGK